MHGDPAADGGDPLQPFLNEGRGNPVGNEISVDPFPKPDPVRMEIGHEAPERGSQTLSLPKGGQDLERKKMGAEDEIGRRLRKETEKFPEKETVDPGQNPGKRRGEKIGCAVKPVEHSGRVSGKSQIARTVEEPVQGGAPLQEVNHLDIEGDGKLRKDGRNGLAGPHVAASDPCPHNQELFPSLRDPFVPFDAPLLSRRWFQLAGRRLPRDQGMIAKP